MEDEDLENSSMTRPILCKWNFMEDLELSGTIERAVIAPCGRFVAAATSLGAIVIHELHADSRPYLIKDASSSFTWSRPLTSGLETRPFFHRQSLLIFISKDQEVICVSLEEEMQAEAENIYRKGKILWKFSSSLACHQPSDMTCHVSELQIVNCAHDDNRDKFVIYTFAHQIVCKILVDDKGTAVNLMRHQMPEGKNITYFGTSPSLKHFISLTEDGIISFFKFEEDKNLVCLRHIDVKALADVRPEDDDMYGQFIHAQVTLEMDRMVLCDSHNNLWILNFNRSLVNGSASSDSDKYVVQNLLLRGGLVWGEDDEDDISFPIEYKNSGFGDEPWRYELQRVEASLRDHACKCSSVSNSKLITGERKFGFGNSSCSLTFLQAKVWMADYQVVSLSTDSDAVVMLMKQTHYAMETGTGVSTSRTSQKEWKEGENNAFLVLYNLCNGQLTIERLESDAVLATSLCSFCPNIIVTEQGVHVPTYSTSQETIVSHIIQYAGVSQAEKISKENRWDQFSIPLHTLEIGIQHKQTDTIAFFLKSREKAFTRFWKGYFSPLYGSPRSGSAFSDSELLVTSPKLMSPSLREKLTRISSSEFLDPGELMRAIGILIKAVHDNSKGHHKFNFFRNLLSMTLDFLNGLLRDGLQIQAYLEDQDDVSQRNIVASDGRGPYADPTKKQQMTFLLDVPESIQHLLQGIVELRAYCKGVKDENRTSTKTSVDGKISSGTTQSVEVIKDELGQYLLEGKIAKMQRIVLESSCPVESDGSYESMRRLALHLAFGRLVQRKLDDATIMVRNMGFTVNNFLQLVLLFTLDRKLRNFLFQELMTRSYLQSPSTDLIECFYRLQQIEKYYSNPSLSKALERKGFLWQQKPNFKVLFETEARSAFHPRSASIWSSNDAEVDHHPCTQYSEIMLQWVRSWNDSTCQRILLDADKALANLSTTSLNLEVICDYLASHHSWAEFGKIIKDLAKDFTLIRSWSIPENFVTNLKCSQYFQDSVQSQLLRCGFMREEDLQDFRALISKLAEEKLLLQERHPADYEHSQVRMDNFHIEMIRYCTQHGLKELLYCYLDHYSVQISEYELLINGVSLLTVPWISYLLRSRRAHQGPTDRLLTVLGNSRMLKQINVDSVNSLLASGHPLLAMAALLVGPMPLFQCIRFNSEDCTPPWHVSASLLREKLEPYPKLMSAIFGTEAEQPNGGLTSDISMYKLIQDNTILDARKFFGWQKMNDTASPSDCVRELPYFSSPVLVERYAAHSRLRYSYYLRQARPNFAYMVFLRDNCQDGFISKIKIHKAKSRLYKIAICHFADLPISASCVVFSEHLHCCSWMLRVDLEAANFILKHCRRSDGRKQYSADQLRDVIVSLLLATSESSKKQLLEMVEEATESFILFNQVKRFSHEELTAWRVAVQFARAHGLNASVKFLKDCAREGAWFPLIVYAQSYQVSPSIVLHILDYHLRDPILKDHLKAVIRNSKEISLNLPVEDQDTVNSAKQMRQKSKQRSKVTTPERDFRAQFYYHLGGRLPDKRDPSESPGAKRKLMEDEPSSNQQTIKAIPLVSPSDVPDDMVDVLLECQDASSPWQALIARSFVILQPFLAVLAACYPEADLVHCLCVWIICRVNQETRQGIFKEVFGELVKDISSPSFLQRHSWSMQDLLTITLLLIGSRQEHAHTLCQGYSIFLQDHILVDLLAFNKAFVDQQDYNMCKAYLSRFLAKIVRQSEFHWGDQEIMLSEAAADMMLAKLHRCTSPFHRRMLLQLYSTVDVSVLFSKRDVNFRELHLIAEVLTGTEVQADFKTLTCGDSAEVQRCKEYIMDELLRLHHFEGVRSLAHQIPLFSSKATLMEIRYDLEELKGLSLWREEQARMEFWESCDVRFSKNWCSPDIAAAFFEQQGQSDSLEISSSERAVLLSTAIKWYRQVVPKVSQAMLLKLEREVWLHKIHVEMEEMNSVPATDRRGTVCSLGEDDVRSQVRRSRAMSGLGEFCANTNQDLAQPVEVDHVLDGDSRGSVLIAPQEVKAFELLIGKLLDENQISQARRVCSYFKRSTKDLDIVMSCIFLAQGTHTIDSLNDSIKSLLANTASRHLEKQQREIGASSLSRSASLGSSAASPSGYMVDWVLVEEHQIALEKLILRSKHGRSCCRRVLACLRVCQRLEIHYLEAIKEKAFSILHRLLSFYNEKDKWQVMKDYISAFELKDAEVADFVTKALKSWIKVYNHGADPSTEFFSVSCYEQAPTAKNVSPLVQLVAQQSTLGSLLMKETFIAAAEMDLAELDLPRLQFEVELLVLAHDSFTFACNMEGISSVLRAARILTSALTKAQGYTLMVRLFTGIARFNEMSYIMDLLASKHHFELLLRKDVEKKSQLKIALLEYIRNNYPKDMDKYEQISVAFGMHREYAEQLEDTGMQQIHSLKERIAGGAKDLEPILKSLTRTFLNAAINYAEVNCLKRSQRCNRLAMLVELQIRNLGAGIRVMGLQDHEVTRLLANYNNFYEALVIADAYDLRSPGTWVEPLYQIVIVNGDFKYADDFISVYQIIGSMANEMAARYRSARVSSQMSTNMKKFLGYVKDIRIKYRIAHDLNLHDVMTSLVEGPSGAFLRDTIFT